MKPLALFLLAASTAFAGDWFISPTAGLVFPSSSAIVYHSMVGRVDYRTGYSQGLQFGRNVGNFELYLSYDHASFKARDITLQTPYGQVSQSDSDNQDQHTVLWNISYSPNVSFYGIRPIVLAGAGATIDEATSLSYQFGAGATRKLAGFDITINYAYRFAQGSQRFGHKTDGSYSIVVQEPDQQMLTLSIGKNF